MSVYSIFSGVPFTFPDARGVLYGMEMQTTGGADPAWQPSTLTNETVVAEYFFSTITGTEDVTANIEFHVRGKLAHVFLSEEVNFTAAAASRLITASTADPIPYVADDVFMSQIPIALQGTGVVFASIDIENENLINITPLNRYIQTGDNYVFAAGTYFGSYNINSS